MTAPFRQVAKGGWRKKHGERTKDEIAYEAVLEQRKTAGEILWYKYEGVTFKIADDLRYTPDYGVLLADFTLEFHEVKGFWTQVAIAKIKVAAATFPVRFKSVRKLAKKDGGGWEVREF